MDRLDAVIVGAGPAGLSAALILGRCRRRVLVCDTGHPRNAVSHALHGFLTRDGVEPAELRRMGREQLRRYPTVEVRDIEGRGCEVRETLEGIDGMLERIVFATGDVLERRAMFFSTGAQQGSDLAARLGCAFTAKGAVHTGEYEITNIHGLYVAGDASRLVQLAIVAAGEGAEAAFAMNIAMLKEDLAARERTGA